MSSEFYQFQVKKADGTLYPFSELSGKVTLIVNVASKCGYTSQYQGLESLFQKYKDKNFMIIGFPSNEFGSQEPGSDQEIQTFCQRNYGVTFPVMSKIEVNGKQAIPLYQWLKKNSPGILGTEGIKWNFTKFLVSADGKNVQRFAPSDTPESMEKDIKQLLKLD